MKPKSKNFQEATTTRVVYVGSELYQDLCAKAIVISHKGGKQITPSQLTRYLITEFADAAEERLIEEMKNS